MRNFILIGALMTLLSGCDHEKRIAALEKETKELKESVDRSTAAIDFDLSSKCADRGNAWARENSAPDRDTIATNNTYHYNKAKNRCFALLEWQYYVDRKNEAVGSTISLWDINENSQVADFGQYHFSRPEPHDGPVVCNIGPTPCHTLDEFNKYVVSFMKN